MEDVKTSRRKPPRYNLTKGVLVTEMRAIITELELFEVGERGMAFWRHFHKVSNGR